MSTPQTIINIVAGVAIDSRYRHSIYFPNRTAQLNYFGGKTVKTFPAYSYCRKNWTLKVEASMEEARNWCYLYFRNSADGDYWFYFINDIEYRGDKTVELSLELDVIQTYMFVWDLQPCHIERQHAEVDYYGCNQVEENLDTGELTSTISNPVQDIDELEELCIIMLATFDPVTTGDSETMNKVLASKHNDIFSGLGVFTVDSKDWSALGMKLKGYSDSGIIDGIITMFMYPKKLVNLGEYVDGKQASWSDSNVCKPVRSTTAYAKTWTISPTVFSHIRSYRCKNKKTLQYPYNFLYVSNNQGGGGIFRYERMKNYVNSKGLEFTINMYGSYSPDATVKMVIEGYNDMGHETAVSLGGFPTCAWNADTYKIWLAQNQSSMNLSNALAGLTIAGGVVTTVASVATGNAIGAVGGVGAMAGGIKSIAGNLSTMKDREVQPPQARGAYSASTNIASGKQTFTFMQRCVTSEHAKIIDDFFTMFGYAMNHTAVPNIHARPAFTYVKTNGCTVAGFVGNADRLKIESVFDNGITFWVNGDKIGDYEQDNPADDGGTES